jgi:hypothetical protein
LRERMQDLRQKALLDKNEFVNQLRRRKPLCPLCPEHQNTYVQTNASSC